MSKVLLFKILGVFADLECVFVIKVLKFANNNLKSVH